MPTSPPTRASLLLRLRDTADAVAWEEFVNLYTPLVFGYCRGRGLPEADAADVTQEVLRAVARSMPGFEYRPAAGAFRAWLFKVTRSKFNTFLDRRRRQPQGSGDTAVREWLETQPCPETDPGWDATYQQRLLDWACGQVCGDFSATTWEAFRLTAIEGRPAQDAAAATGLSVGAVYIARSRVTQRIRELVSTVDDESPPLF